MFVVWSQKFDAKRALGAVTAILCLALLAGGAYAVIFGGRSSGPVQQVALQHTAAASSTPAGASVNKLAEAIGFPMDRPVKSALAVEERAGSVETQDDWGSQLRESKYFERLKTSKSANWRYDPDAARRSGLIKADPSDDFATRLNGARGLSGGSLRNPLSGDGGSGTNWNGTYRTVCVRTCDGFYWPVSFATTKDNFDKDQSTCERSCGGPKQARLFVYKNPGEQIEDMEDLEGKPYKRMTSAFQFRASYDESCKCRPHPWEDASRDLHKSYALQAQAEKGDKRARDELKDLRKKIQSNADSGITGSKSPGRADLTAPATPAVPGRADEKRRQSRAAPPISLKSSAVATHSLTPGPGQASKAQFVPRIVVMQYVPSQTAVSPNRPARPNKPQKDAELGTTGMVVRR